MKKLIKIMSLVSFCLGGMSTEASGMKYDHELYEKNVFFTNKPLPKEVMNGQETLDGSIYVEAIIGSELWRIYDKCSYLFEWLRCVYISKNTRSIGTKFSGCKQLEYLKVPPEVDTIDREAFKDCTALEEIELPYKVNTIDGGVFENCTALKRVIILSNKIKVSSTAFEGCNQLEVMTIVPNKPTIIYYKSNYMPKTVIVGLVVFNKERFLGEYGVENGKLSINFDPGDWFFGDEDIKQLTLSGNIRSIEERAFYSCKNLEKIAIPSSVTSIGNRAFDYCCNLKEINIPNTVISIGKFIFSDCVSLKSITIPESVTSIKDYAFSNCTSLKNIAIPESVTSIEDCAFSFCDNLKSIIIPDSVTFFGRAVFLYCSNLKNISLSRKLFDKYERQGRNLLDYRARQGIHSFNEGSTPDRGIREYLNLYALTKVEVREK